MPDNKSLNLTVEDRKAAIDEIMKLQSSLSFMKELLAGGNFNADEANCHMSLIKFAHDGLSKLFGTDPISKDLDNAYNMLRDANGKVADLEKQLGAGTTAAAAAAKLSQLEDWFCTWYQLSGFHYMTLEHNKFGLGFETSDEIEHAPIMPEDISFGDRELAVKIAPLVDYAFENYDKKTDTFHDNLRDTQRNHDALRALFKSAFPKCRVHGFRSHTDGPDEFMLRMKGFVPWEDIEKWRDGMLETAGKIEGRNTGALYVKKADIACMLASRTYVSHAGPDKVKAAREELAWLRTVTDLWDKATAFRKTAGADPDVIPEKLTLGWEDDTGPRVKLFRKGTSYERIGRWFSETFRLDVARDLVGSDTEGNGHAED